MAYGKKFRFQRRCVSQLTVHVGGVAELIDMLRYDCCYPASEAESGKLIALLDGGSADALAHVIRLERAACDSDPATAERWKSFGCTVLDERGPDAAPITDDEIRALVAGALLAKSLRAAKQI